MKVVGKIYEVLKLVFRGTDRTIAFDPDLGNEALTTDLTLTLPDTGTDTEAELVPTKGAQTLEDKTLTSPVLNTPDINDPDIDGGTIDASTISGSTLETATINSPDINTPDIDGGTIDGSTIGTSTLNSPDINTPDIDGGTIDDTAITGGSATDTVVKSALNTSGATFDVTGPAAVVTIPSGNVTLNTTPFGHTLVSTEAELIAELPLGGSIGINANITLTAGMVEVSVAGTELYSTSRSYTLTGFAGQDAVINVTADDCVIRDLVIDTEDDTQVGVETNSQSKTQLTNLTILMPSTSTATAIAINGSFNRVSNLLADSNGGAITGVTLGGASSDNLVSGVIVA